jgi:hypothetical protein
MRLKIMGKYLFFSLLMEAGQITTMASLCATQGELEKLMSETGMKGLPITTRGPEHFILELIHLVEGCTKRIVKLFVTEVKPGRHGRKILLVFSVQSQDSNSRKKNSPNYRGKESPLRGLIE